jgi:hypothetical protein
LITYSDITPEVVAAFAGRPVMGLAFYTIYANSPSYSVFTRSVETYSIHGSPYVIVSVNGAGGGGTSPLPTVKKPSVSISAVDLQASETAGDAAQFLIVLNAPTTKNIRIKLIISGKATNGKDYQKIPRAVLIPAGNVSGIIEIEPINDVKREGPEKVTIKLAAGGKAYSLKGAVASVTIIDND